MRLATLILALLLVGGCSSARPTSTPTAGPTPNDECPGGVCDIPDSVFDGPLVRRP